MDDSIIEWDELLNQDWDNLGSFSLTSKEVPHLLNTLKNKEGEQQRSAFLRLTNTILSPVDEHTIFEITPKVIPCLCFLMKHSHKIFGVQHIASLLCELAIICDPFYYCYGVWTPTDLIEQNYPEGKEVVVLIQAEWQNYLSALDHNDVKVRIATIRLLALIPDAWSELRLRLRLQCTLKHIKKSSNINNQELAAILIALAHCQLDGALDTSIIEKFLAPVSSSPTSIVENAATIAMVVVHQEKTKPYIVKQLCNIQKTTFTTYYSQWYKGHLNEYADDLLNIYWPKLYDELH
ncbi:hypothetical protein [Aquimarina algiphila]|uniref:hypothetical protein n=1 Tax=Aquimarina algiphila TaxID=2047982 RepID=UPI00232C6DDB|nr:hypothetical protein [Aquimarina algiphila]